VDGAHQQVLSCQKKIVKNLEISFEEDFRLRDNFSTADRFSTTLDLNYKVCPYLKLGGAYNLINFNHEKKGWEVRHRYYFYATGMYKYNNFKFSLRERFQSTYRVGVNKTAKRANPKLYLRSRAEIEYDIPNCKFEPFISFEIFNILNDPIENGINELRYIAGCSYKINKRNAISLSYRYSNEIDDEDSSKNMVCLGYSLKF
jgi:Protein of unknown function (DUF2490).